MPRIWRAGEFLKEDMDMTQRHSVQPAHVGDFGVDAPPVVPSASVVFVADDDASVCEALETLIHDAGWQARILPSAYARLSQPEDPVPRCVVLDVSPPHSGGLTLEEWLAGEHSETPIVCITAQADVSTTVRAMKAGAVDVLTKPVCPELLLEAIRHALERSETMLRRSAEGRQLRDRYASLSQRERQVMALVVSGLLNKQVGGELGISEITVKAHRGSVMRKMNAASFAQLVQMAGKLPFAHATAFG